MRCGGHARGASTITQQLVGNMHPDIIDRATGPIARKIHEQNAAREMERHYDKEQILEAYLNQIHFGHGWYGIEEAARHYFGIRRRGSRSRRRRRSRHCRRAPRSTIPCAIPTARRNVAISYSRSWRSRGTRRLLQ